MAPASVSVLNLAVQRWTYFADVYPATPSPVALTGGPFAASADALAGNDRITGTGDNSVNGGVGSLLSNGRFYMSLGNDYFAGTGAAGDTASGDGAIGNNGAAGISLTSGSILNTGVTVGLLGLLSLDDDTVVGVGGAGSDGTNGSNGADGAWAGNGVAGGAGGAGGVGINVECGSQLLTGDGRDSITGTGGVGGDGGNGGAGGNGTTPGAGGAGGAAGAGGIGIYVSSSSSIDTGRGADSITGIGGAAGTAGTAGANGVSTGAAVAGNGAGIYNKGNIYMGAGRDTLDALQGGFAGCGNYYMGSDNDTVKGFGKGTFYGDSGWDTLVLPGQGSDYTIELINGVQGNYSISDNCSKVTMTALSFESITFTGTV